MPSKVSWGWNLRKLPIEVEHSRLERLDEESIYKSWCPECRSGVLLVSRPLGIYKLNRAERCTLCGQPFWYTDAGVGHETFLEEQPRHLTPEILAAYGKLIETLPEMSPPGTYLNFWERIREVIDAE
jgi:hypothetical protein